jgi:predicted PurR-regulated permease PerM
MIYLCIIFNPPVYFLARKKWGGFILNSILYGIACLCAISIVGILVAPVFWILAVGHAGFTYRREMLAHHAELIATKMAEKMQKQ